MFFYTAIIMAIPALAHMEMTQPYALRSKFDPANKAGGQIDYSMTSPLEASGSNFPCKGYQNDRPFHTTANYTAGSKYQLTLAGSATHEGGSCQISLSYDNGKTFRVIKSMIGGCPLTDNYDFTIPSYAPSGQALLGWTWQNLVGNREYYMNCAEVNIAGTQAPQRRSFRKARSNTFNSFTDLPYIWKANMPVENDCKTIEGQIPVYPNPGPDVIYGGGSSSSAPPTPGTCDAVGPPGPTYKDLGIGGDSGKSETSPSAAAVSSIASSAAPSTPALSSSLVAAVPQQQSSSPPVAVASSSSISLNSSTSSSGSASGTGSPSGMSSQGSSPSPSPQVGSANSLPYGITTSPQYLPCQSGSFLCTSSTSWATCVNGNQYIAMGNVAGGMMCSPHSTTGGSNVSSGGGSSGTFRDDQIVAATSVGSK